jgi:hypothetical protein
MDKSPQSGHGQHYRSRVVFGEEAAFCVRCSMNVWFWTKSGKTIVRLLPFPIGQQDTGSGRQTRVSTTSRRKRELSFRVVQKRGALWGGAVNIFLSAGNR